MAAIFMILLFLLTILSRTIIRLFKWRQRQVLRGRRKIWWMSQMSITLSLYIFSKLKRCFIIDISFSFSIYISSHQLWHIIAERWVIRGVKHFWAVVLYKSLLQFNRIISGRLYIISNTLILLLQQLLLLHFRFSCFVNSLLKQHSNILFSLPRSNCPSISINSWWGWRVIIILILIFFFSLLVFYHH